MSTSRHIDKICCIVLAAALLITVLFSFGESLGIEVSAGTTMGYESKLFDTSYVHTIDIVMDDWDSFIANCEDEEYELCAAVIDGEAFRNIAIRAKGNTSLSSVSSYGNDRYSFKIEFDHYDSTKTYYGLDKLSLNNIIQDNTYMKDYIVYQMMNSMGVNASLCSFAYITVNGEDWGLYLALEGVEDSFLERCYGTESDGNLYKPDSTSMGGGKGNGGGFDMNDFMDKFSSGSDSNHDSDDNSDPNTSSFDFKDMMNNGEFDTGNFDFGDLDTENFNFENFDFESFGGDFGGGKDDKDFGGGMDDNSMMMSSSDTLLSYTDDDFDSYSNIWESAKTDITDSDKERLIASLKTISTDIDNIESAVDVEQVIKYFAVHNFVCNFDSYTGSMIHNYYLYEENGVLSMIPWDYNLAFGGFQSSGTATSMVNYPIDTPVSGGTVDSRPMLAWIFASEEYTELYHRYLAEFIEEYFDSGYFTEMIDTVTEMISPYVEKDPTKFCTYDEFVAGAAALKEFCLLRAESVEGQLNGTIPSTSDGQSADSSSLIDASGINISDMGSMNGDGGNGGGFGGGNDFENKADKIMKNFNEKHASENTSDIGSDKQNTSEMNDKMTFANVSDENTPEMPSGDFTPDNASSDSDGNAPEMPSGDFTPDNASGGFTQPDMNNSESNNMNSTVILLVISAVVLAAGIAFSMIFKNRV